MNNLFSIEKIRVGEKDYFITILEIRDYYCAYVYLDGEEKDICGLDNCTYNEGKVHGVDTAHYWNMNQSKEERLDDVRNQIRELILSSLK